MSIGSHTSVASDAAGTHPDVINRSCRLAVMLLFIGALVWSILGLGLGLISSVKMHVPGMWAKCEWVSYGRIRPAFFTAIIYGFASQAALGAALWMLARLGRTALAQAGLATAGAILWNGAVAIGILQIMAGQTTGFTWMEMPRHSAALLAGAYFLIAISAFYTLRSRQNATLYISHWFFILGLVAFPALLSVGYLLGVVEPLRGVMQVVVNAYYTNGLLNLWLTPMTLGIAYYLIPKCSGKPIYSSQTAAFGFWALVICANWSGMSQLIGGPLPRWIISVGVSAKWLLLLAAAAYAINYYLTFYVGKPAVSSEPAKAFVVIGSLMYGIWMLLDVFGTIPSIAPRVAFTLYGQGLSHLALFGFVGMILYGAIYFVSERVLNSGFERRGWLQAHFLLSILGVLLLAVGYVYGGYTYGGNLNNPDVPMVAATKGMVPFIGMASLGYLVLLLGQMIFAWAVLRNVVQATAEERSTFCRWCCGEIQAGGKLKVRA